MITWLVKCYLLITTRYSSNATFVRIQLTMRQNEAAYLSVLFWEFLCWFRDRIVIVSVLEGKKNIKAYQWSSNGFEMREKIRYKRSWKEKKGFLWILLIVVFVSIIATTVVLIKVRHFKGKNMPWVVESWLINDYLQFI